MQHPSAHSHTRSQPNQTAQPALLQTRRAAQPCHQGLHTSGATFGCVKCSEATSGAPAAAAESHFTRPTLRYRRGPRVSRMRCSGCGAPARCAPPTHTRLVPLVRALPQLCMLTCGFLTVLTMVTRWTTQFCSRNPARSARAFSRCGFACRSRLPQLRLTQQLPPLVCNGPRAFD